MEKNRFCVIMAGGVGSRFWPMSKEERPKQFLDILGTGKTFIRQTYERFRTIIPNENFVVLTNYAYKNIVLEEIPELEATQVLCEPARRNTAPCIAYAAYHINAIDPDAAMVVAPSDHLITDTCEFERVIKASFEFVSENDALMTIGLKPTRPETGYGYIQTCGQVDLNTITKVKTFTEKPDRELAQVFVSSGEFLWNSGIFIWSCRSIMEAYSKYLPEVDSVFAEGADYFGTSYESNYIERAFGSCKSISVDYGIMEKADNVYVYSADFGWSDIGTWGSLFEHAAKDDRNNTVSGGKVVVKNVSNSIVRVGKDKKAIIDGLDNYIVVCDENVLLVCSREREQNIKIYIDELNK